MPDPIEPPAPVAPAAGARTDVADEPAPDAGPGPTAAAADGTAPDGTAPDGTAPDGTAPDGGPPAWTGRPPTSLLRAAVRPRMLALLLVFLAGAALCGWLGSWQLDRAHERGGQQARQHEATVEAAAARPIDDVLAPQTTFTNGMVGEKVTVTGHYVADDQLLVTGRDRAGAAGADGGSAGSVVLTPLRVDEGAGTGAVLPVARGWVPDPTGAAAAPSPPSGTVSLTGYLQASEGVFPDDAGTLASGHVEAISSAELVATWGSPIYTGYLVLSASDPAQSGDLTPVAPPKTPGSDGLNLQNLGYAAQWWIFGTFALLLWWRLVRDEAAGDVRTEDDEDAPGEAAQPGEGQSLPVTTRGHRT